MKIEIDPQDNCHDTLKTAFRNLIKSNLISQQLWASDFREARKYVNDLSYAKEIATIKIASSRRSGHSTIILDMINEFYNIALILTHNIHQRDFYMERIRYETLKPNSNFLGGQSIERTPQLFRTSSTTIYLGTINSLDSLRGLPQIEAAFIDCASFLSNKKKDQVYDVLLPYMHFPKNPPSTFQYIFVQ